MEANVTFQTIFVSIAAGAFAITISDRFKFPSIVLYLALGIILGPHFLDIISPKDAFGNGLSMLIVVFVSIILFEGGLSLDLQSLKLLKKSITKQLIFGIIITMGVAWLASYFIFGLSTELALVFSSLTVVTGPTVIMPIIKRINLNPKVKCFLSGESVLIDAIGAILAIVVLQFVIKQELLRYSVTDFALSVSVGLMVGLSFGVVSKYLLKISNLINGKNFSIFILGLVFLCYFLAEMLSKEAGIMSVAIFGLIMSTIKYRIKEKLLNFKDKLSRVTISILFILLAAGFNLNDLFNYWLEGCIVVILIILARFIVVFLSTRKNDFNIREKLFLGWVGPRGIIALSVASIAVIQLQSIGNKDARLIEILIFLLISITVIMQGLSAKFVAKKLKILVEGDGDIIILGVNNLTLSISKVWRQLDEDVLFIDSYEANCKMAEKEGFKVLHGNCLDPSLYEDIDLGYYRTVLSATTNSGINTLFCRFCKENYGIKNLYSTITEEANKVLFDIIIK